MYRSSTVYKPRQYKAALNKYTNSQKFLNRKIFHGFLKNSLLLTRGVNRMVRHDTIRYIDSHTQRYDIFPET